jgi:hypothetical protein
LSISTADTLMDFRTAANQLGKQITTADIASALGISPHSVRQARLLEEGAGYRRPPAGWQHALIRMAKQRCKELEALVAELERS